MLVVVGATSAGCGSGGDGSSGSASTATGGPPAATPPVAAGSDYPRSLVLGLDGPQDVLYTPAASTATQASVTATTSSTLLRSGTTAVLAEHVDPALAGLRVICVSGNGESTNVVTHIDPGVIAESAAVLLDSRWSAIDPVAAWSNAVSAAGVLTGWQNCGVKPEGAPSPSSRLRPQSDRSYSEDVYDGNPGTTFNTVLQRVPAATVAAMLSAAGYLTIDDPTRRLRLTLRAYADTSGNTIFVETGVPAPDASGATRGFISLYTRTPG